MEDNIQMDLKKLNGRACNFKFHKMWRVCA